MQHLEVSGAVRHIYIYIYVIRRLKFKQLSQLPAFGSSPQYTSQYSILFSENSCD